MAINIRRFFITPSGHLAVAVSAGGSDATTVPNDVNATLQLPLQLRLNQTGYPNTNDVSSAKVLGEITSDQSNLDATFPAVTFALFTSRHIAYRVTNDDYDYDVFYLELPYLISADEVQTFTNVQYRTTFDPSGSDRFFAGGEVLANTPNFTDPLDSTEIFNAYSGPTTQIRLSVPGIAQNSGFPVVTATGNSGGFTVRWFWAGARDSAPIASISNITAVITSGVNGSSPRTLTIDQFASTPSVNPIGEVDARFIERANLNTTAKREATELLLPGETVTLNVPAGEFKISEFELESGRHNTGSWTAGDAGYNNFAEVSIPITNNVTNWPTVEPDFNYAFVDSGTGFIFSFTRSVKISDTNHSVTFTRASDGVSSVFRITTSQPNPWQVRYNLESGPPLLNGQQYNGFTYPANKVYFIYALNTSNNAGNRSRFYNNFFSSSGGDTGETPTLAAATINGNGDTLTLTFDTEVNYIAGEVTVSTLYSDLGIFSLAPLGTPTNTTVLTFDISALSDTVRVNDVVKVSLPEGLVQNFIGSQPNEVVTDYDVINFSTQPYDQPELVDAGCEVDTDGITVNLEFDRGIIVNQTNFENYIRIRARDKNTTDIRVGQPVAGSLSGVDVTTTRGIDVEGPIVTDGSKELSFTIFGMTVYDEDALLAPRDGDDLVTLDSSGFANIFINYVSDLAGEPVTAGAIGDPSDITLSFELINNSLVEEPQTAVIPTVKSAAVVESGGLQYLEIQWDQADGIVSVQYAVPEVTPTLISAFRGNIDLTDREIVTRDNDDDTTRYLMTPRVYRASDSEILTLNIPAALVVSVSTGSPNAAVNGQTTTNNSTVSVPVASPGRPEPQELYIGTDGKTLGIYWDLTVFPGGDDANILSLLSGNKTASYSAFASGLLIYAVNQDIPVFKGERVLVSLPESFAVYDQDGLTSEAYSDLVPVNNSLIPVPRAPVLDSASCTATSITLVFDVNVAEGSVKGYMVSEFTGRKTVIFDSVSDNTVTAVIDGRVYDEESEVKVFLPVGFVVDSEYGVTGNKEVSNFTVTNNSSTAFPDTGHPLQPEKP